MASPALKLIDGASGEVVEATDNAMLERIEELESDLSSAERELRKARRENKKLRTERQNARDSYPERELVHKLFDFWQLRTKHSKAKLTPDRFDAIKNALEQGYTAREIAEAIAGAAYDPFITLLKNGKQERHDDLTLILRDGKHIEAYARKAPNRAQTQSQTQTSPHESAGDPL